MSRLVDKIIAKVTRYAMDEVLGKDVGEARDELQEEELNQRIARYKTRLGLLNFIKPKDSALYYPKQDAFIRAVEKCQVTCGIGANQIGKTSAICAVGLSWALGEYLWTGEPVIGPDKKPVKPPLRIFYGGKSFTMAHTEVTMRKMNDLLPFEALGIMVDRQQGRSAHRIRFPEDLGGSEIKLLSYEQDPEDYEGTTWHLALWDEPPPRHAYIATKRGCMKYHAPMAFAFTPLKEPWLYEEIYKNPNAVHVTSPEQIKRLKRSSMCMIHFQLDDSPYLTREAKDELIATLDPEEIEARVHGQWKHLLGRIYKDFDKAKHVLPTEEFYEKHPNWKTYTPFMVVDPADRRPFACIWGLVSPREEVFFIDEWPNQPYHKMKSYDNEASEYVSIFKQKEEALGLSAVTFRLMDPNFGETPKAGTGRTLVEEFDNLGLYFDTRIDNDQTSGHMVVREALRKGRVFWLDRCFNAILAMESYTWDEYRASATSARMPKEKPQEAFKDFADVVRYAFKFPVVFLEIGGLKPMNPINPDNGGLGRKK